MTLSERLQVVNKLKAEKKEFIKDFIIHNSYGVHGFIPADASLTQAQYAWAEIQERIND